MTFEVNLSGLEGALSVNDFQTIVGDSNALLSEKRRKYINIVWGSNLLVFLNIGVCVCVCV